MLCVNIPRVLHPDPIYQPGAKIEKENDSVPMTKDLNVSDKVAAVEFQSCSTKTFSRTEADPCPSCPKA